VVIAWRTGSLLATVAVGMAALLALGFAPGYNHFRLYTDKQ
jgi:hypothetical protein